MKTGSDPPEHEWRPASPIRYGRLERRADRRNGRRDGLKRIPSLAQVSESLKADVPNQMPTPYLEMLLSRARDMMEHERLLFVTATTAIRTQLADLDSRAGGLRAAIEMAARRMEQSRSELTDADLVPRNTAEEQYNEAFLHLRRESQRAHRIAAAEAEYLRLRDEQREVRHELARVAEQVESRLAVARLHALRISAHLATRVATYWEGLILVHRDGAHLAPLLPHLTPRLPDWVVPPNADTATTALTSIAGPTSTAGLAETATAESTVDRSAPAEKSAPTRQRPPAAGRQDQPSPRVDQPVARSSKPEGRDETSPQSQPLSAHRR
jgi:hypothetical protein